MSKEAIKRRCFMVIVIPPPISIQVFLNLASYRWQLSFKLGKANFLPSDEISMRCMYGLTLRIELEEYYS